jgi:peptide chain release factor subunit 1
MLSAGDLQALIEFCPESPVLSVYFDLDPGAGAADMQRLRLRQMLKPFEEPAADDVKAILRFMDHAYDWSARSLALFSCQAEGFLRSFTLSIPLRSRARWLDRPYVKPLAGLIDRYGDLGIAAVDQQGARFFHFHLGELIEQEGALGEEVRHIKRGGGSQAAGRRGGAPGQASNVEEVAERNLRQAGRQAAAFFSRTRCRRLLLGGTDQNVAAFIPHLPKAWQAQISGSFAVELAAGHKEILSRAMAVLERAEHEREQQLVQQLLTSSAKGADGVLSLGETLAAASAGRVYTLIVLDGLRAPGFRCRQCGHLSADPVEICPFCGGPLGQIEDAVEMAVQDVLRSGGEVEIVAHSEALAAAGGIGGMLRY